MLRRPARRTRRHRGWSPRSTRRAGRRQFAAPGRPLAKGRSLRSLRAASRPGLARGLTGLRTVKPLSRSGLRTSLPRAAVPAPRPGSVGSVRSSWRRHPRDHPPLPASSRRRRNPTAPCRLGPAGRRECTAEGAELAKVREGGETGLHALAPAARGPRRAPRESPKALASLAPYLPCVASELATSRSCRRVRSPCIATARPCDVPTRKHGACPNRTSVCAIRLRPRRASPESPPAGPGRRQAHLGSGSRARERYPRRPEAGAGRAAGPQVRRVTPQ